jgi:polyferredoxin
MTIPTFLIPQFAGARTVKMSIWFHRFRALFFLLILSPNILWAQYQKDPPDFGGTYSFPTPLHPEPTLDWLRFLDVGLLAFALGISAWLVFKRRNRTGVILLSLGSVAYFGFFRKGCICSIGAIQNVVLCLTDSRYVMSFSALAVFFLPIVVTLLFGRLFCGGVCPLGAIQDLVVVRPLKVPRKLDRALRWLQFIYLGAAVFFAGWGLHLTLGSWKINLGQRFLICEWDPFIPIFRRSGPMIMVAVGIAFLLAGMFIGRPYCRWLCPYGGILSILSRIAWKNLSITPDKELDCGMCSEACPYGAIVECRADRAYCVNCARCYESCPRQKRLDALRAGPKKAGPSIAIAPHPWAAIARTWTGLAAGLIVVLSLGFLLTTYVIQKRSVPRDKALIESLIENAKNDATVQKILQPELERQQKALTFRRHVYDRVGWILLASAALLVLWLNWLRPKQGTGAGLPANILRIIEKPPPTRPQRKRPGDSVTAALD